MHARRRDLFDVSRAIFAKLHMLDASKSQRNNIYGYTSSLIKFPLQREIARKFLDILHVNLHIYYIYKNNLNYIKESNDFYIK